MPTVNEVAAYGKQLPQIYRDIMSAFPAIEPRRRAGYGLAFQTLTMHFINTDRHWLLGDVQEACKRLSESGFIEIRNGIFAHPTELGEQLIMALTGAQPVPTNAIPQLPAHSW